MILLVDIGNTRLKWAFLHRDEFEFGGAISYSNDSLLSLLSSIWSSITYPERVIVSNVAGDKIVVLLQQWILDNFHCKVQFIVTKKEHLRLVNAYSIPSQLGVDRWLAMLGIWNQHQSGFCVVDCGTAVTFDAVDNQGNHLGGLILPGLDLMQSSLLTKLPGCRQPEPRNHIQTNILANNTYHAISGGCLYAVAAFIDELTADLLEELGENAQCIMTGGNAQKVMPMLQHDYLYKPHLILEGLTLMAT